MNDDELFDKQLREHWGAPRPAPAGLKAQLLSATAAPMLMRRRWMAISAAAAVLIGVVTVGTRVTHREVADEEVGWLVDNDEDPPDMTEEFDFSAMSEVD